MSDNSQITSAFLEPLLSYISNHNLYAPELEQQLREAMKAPSLVKDDFYLLLTKLHQVDPVTGLGLRLGQAISMRHFGIVGYLGLTCGNLGQALSRYRRFLDLLQTGLDAKVVPHGSNLRIHWAPRVASPPLSQEYSVATFVSFYQALLGKNVAPIRIGLLCAEPDDAIVLEAIMACPIEFDCSSLYVEIPARLMSVKLSGKDPYLRNLLEQQAVAMLHPIAANDVDDNEFYERLQWHIVNALKANDLRAEVVAKDMGFSLRSFYRELSVRDYNFRSIVADVRLRLAKQYLSNIKLSHTDIALKLGYSEHSSFIRAFRGWTGMTPREFRERTLKLKHLPVKGGVDKKFSG